MNQKNAASLRPPSSTGRVWLYPALLCLACVTAITSQSLWIDEACAARKAMQPTLPAWWREMAAQKGSDLQMPLYMIWLWVCVKVFGSSEAALRAVNVFWFVPGLVALMWVLARDRALQLAVFLTAVFSPFVWYYLNEARPYAMQLGASLFLFAALYRWSWKSVEPETGESLWVWGFVLALIVLSGASLLGMIWAAGALVGLSITLLPKDRWLKYACAHAMAWLVCVGSLAALGGYYLWTLKSGARATGIAATDWKNVAFIAYELIGFAGLGPGRLEIREGGLQAFKSYGPELAVYSGLVSLLLGCGIADLWRRNGRGRFFWWALLVAAPAGLILAAGFVTHFRVLGRHFAPPAVVVIFLLAVGVTILWQKRMSGKIAVACFFVFYIASSLSLRFEARHEKDNFRSAVAFGKAALNSGRSVWWNAAPEGAKYYGLPLTDNPHEVGKALAVFNPARDALARVPSPDYVIVSKPDIFDNSYTTMNFLKQSGYQQHTNLQAFVIWHRGQ